MSYPIGPLAGTDEGFCHQIADTFAVVGSTDQAWTEKVCAMAMARDGSLQLGFGLGKYANRNVMDGYGGVSRGVEQVTVRSSRRLAPEPDRTAVGPLRYEVVEPLRVVRFVLEPNDCQPLAFDWTFEAALPAALEDRSVLRDGYRTTADLVRYHQIGQASGWVELDGERTIIDDGWISTRDHSWGLRYGVGAPLPDVEQVDALDGLSFHMIWSPLLFSLPDGGRYGMLLHFQIVSAPGLGVVHKVVMGGVEHPDGRVERWLDLDPSLSYDPTNRRLQGGTIRATTADGTTRELTVEVLDATGFHLGAGLYFGFDGHHHGAWRGDLHIDGERIPDCSTPDAACRLHQIRDTVVRVTDSLTNATGLGNCQPILTDTTPDSFW